MGVAGGFDRAKVIDEICERVSNGESLRALCREDHMPSWRTVYDWLSEDGNFASRFARARELGEEAIGHECLVIADTPLIGEEVEESENGVKIKRGDMLGHRKLQIETRLKLLAKWNPKKWGDRIQQDVQHTTQTLTDEQLEAKIAELQARAGDGSA